MAPNAIDLTTLSAVKLWTGISNSNITDDSIIQDVITSFSAQVLHMTGRGPANGGLPAVSPFTSVVSYDDVYDGSGSLRQPIRNWPIASVTSVTINGVAVQQSTSVNVYGWVVDGDAKFISIRGGYMATRPWSTRFQNALPGPGFAPGIQNVEVVYTAGFASVPFDLELAARKQCGLLYKRRQWIGQRQQAMAQGAGTMTFDSSEMEPDVVRTIMYYQRRVA